MGNIIIAQLNINSLRNKFHSLVELVGGKVDVLVICETKLDQTFTKNTFHISGYKKPYRKDRNGDGGGVIVYVREDIPSQELIIIAYGEQNLLGKLGPMSKFVLEVYPH